MDMRMLNYLERKFTDERRDVSERSEETYPTERTTLPTRRRSRIGFEDDVDDRRARYAHHFDEDDLKETKMQRGQTSSKSHPQMQELLELMEKSFNKEMHDVLRYCEMKEICEEIGLDEIAEGLEELSRDEFMHAKFFKMGLRYLDEEPEKKPELAKLWHRVEKKMNKY